MAFDIIVSGHLCADLLPDTSRMPLSALSTPGKLYEVGALNISTGGAVSNTGLAIHRLGANVGLMTTVGDDLLGRVIIARLKDRDERLGDLVKLREGIASSYSVILSPQNTDRIILHCTGNNDHFDIDDIDFDLVQQARIFHLGYPPYLQWLYSNGGAHLIETYRRIHAAGVVTSLDMALPDPNSISGKLDWRTMLQNLLPYVDVFLPSLEETVFMLRRADYDRWNGRIIDNVSRAYIHALTEEMIDMGAAISGIKLGAHGFYLNTTADRARLDRLSATGVQPDEWHDVSLWHPAFKVDVVGTVGAGDSTFGAFLTTLLHGYNPADAVQFSCAVGACNVEADDATSGVRSWDETVARIESGWATLDLSLPD